MRFKAIQTCFIGHHLLKPGQEIELADDYPETAGVLEALNRPPKPEDEEDSGSDSEGDPSKPEDPSKPKRSRKPKTKTE